MGRTIGLTTLLSKQYDGYELEPKFKAGLGEISKPFRWLVFGKPKNGKTSLLVQFCKSMVLHCGAKIYYNSIEEGDSKTFQKACINANMAEIAHLGKFMTGDRDTFDEMVEKIKKGNYHIIVIDSLDYINLTKEQYKKLIKLFPRKSFIIASWEQNGKPLGKYARDIEFMVDMVTHVKNFTANTRGRFGVGKFTIWERKLQEGEQATLELTH